jgi:hypothetical protein
MTINYEQNAEGLTITILTGVVQDQAGLHGLLSRIRDLGLTLITVQRMDERREKIETSAGDLT